MIVVENLTKRYRGHKVLDNLSVNLNKGKALFVLGENGSGKSTFLKCLVSALYYDGIINRTDGEKLIYAPEKVQFPHYLSVKTFLNIMCDNCQNLDFYLEKYHLEVSKNTKFSKLSKGMYQKVVIIGTILTNADFYIFDEPLSGLDDYSQKTFMDDIKELINKGKGVVISTHHLERYPTDIPYDIIKLGVEKKC